MIEIFKYKNIINRFALLEKKTRKATPPPKPPDPPTPKPPDNEDTPLGEPLKADIKPVQPVKTDTTPNVQGATAKTAKEKRSPFAYAASTAKGHEAVQKGVGAEAARTTPRVGQHTMKYPDDISKMLGTGVPSDRDEVTRLRNDRRAGQTPTPRPTPAPVGRPRNAPTQPTNQVGVQGAKGVEAPPPKAPVVPKPGEAAEAEAQSSVPDVDTKVKDLRDRLNKAKTPVTPAEGVKQDLKTKAPGGTPPSEAPAVTGTAPTGPPPPTGGGSEGVQQPKDPESDVTQPPAGKENKKTVADDLKDKAKQPGSGVEDKTPKEAPPKEKKAEPPPQETPEQKRARVAKENIRKEQETRDKAKKETMGAEEASKKAKTEKERIAAEMDAMFAARSAEKKERSYSKDPKVKIKQQEREKDKAWTKRTAPEMTKDELTGHQYNAMSARMGEFLTGDKKQVNVGKRPVLPKKGKGSVENQYGQRADQIKASGYVQPAPATEKKTRIAWAQHISTSGTPDSKTANKAAVKDYAAYVAGQTKDTKEKVKFAAKDANKFRAEKAAEEKAAGQDAKSKARSAAKEKAAQDKARRHRIKRNKGIRKGFHNLFAKGLGLPQISKTLARLSGNKASIGQGADAAATASAVAGSLGRTR